MLNVVPNQAELAPTVASPRELPKPCPPFHVCWTLGAGVPSQMWCEIARALQRRTCSTTSGAACHSEACNILTSCCPLFARRPLRRAKASATSQPCLFKSKLVCCSQSFFKQAIACSTTFLSRCEYQQLFAKATANLLQLPLQLESCHTKGAFAKERRQPVFRKAGAQILL